MVKSYIYKNFERRCRSWGGILHRGPNEIAYARIADPLRGGAYVSRLTEKGEEISVLITRHARERNDKAVTEMIEHFHKSLGESVKIGQFVHALNTKDVRELHWLNVDSASNDEIRRLIRRLQNFELRT